MNTHIRNLFHGSLLVCCLSMPIAACSDDATPLSSETKLIEFSAEDYETIIDEATQTILVKAPESVTDFSHTKLNFTLSEGAVAELENLGRIESGYVADLNAPTYLSVIAPDRSRSHWTITATNNDYTMQYGMGRILTASRSNEGVRGKAIYLEQHDSQTYPDNNCAPACAAMAVLWAHDRVPTSFMTVEFARNFFTDGKINWTPEKVQTFVSTYAAATATAEFEKLPFHYNDSDMPQRYAEWLMEKIDEGKILVTPTATKFHTLNMNMPEQHTNRYYTNEFDHSLLYKGYRVVDGVTYIEVFDPWSKGYTYADGSFMGENRYYLASDLAKSIKEKTIGIVLTIGPKE